MRDVGRLATLDELPRGGLDRTHGLLEVHRAFELVQNSSIVPLSRR